MLCVGISGRSSLKGEGGECKTREKSNFSEEKKKSKTVICRYSTGWKPINFLDFG